MEDKTLLKLSLIVSLTGILFLMIISDNMEIKEYKIKDLTKKQVNKDIKVKGTITKVTETPGLYIFNINDNTGDITAILFKEDPINLTVSQEVILEGKLVEYKDRLEINVQQILSN